MPLAVPVLRPQLPSAAAILPYLQRIDASRVYSNWGPLVTELASRLETLFATPAGSIVCCASGMSALVGAILATAGMAGARKKKAIVPAFTFAASGLAVQSCGYRPVLVSVDASTWTFTPDDLLARPALLEGVGLVMPVAPFGRPLDTAAWDSFTRTTGIPVVIDAAACFEAVQDGRMAVGSTPIAVSLHATKTFGMGEGGLVISRDAVVVEGVAQALNFGFSGSRNSAVPSINGKMSEYAAAVGLAELDGWPVKLARYRAVARAYEEALRAEGVRDAVWLGPAIGSCYALLTRSSDLDASSLAEHLASRGVETRFWYGTGLSGHTIFQDCERHALHARELAPKTLLGLPMSVDLGVDDQCRVASLIASYGS